MSTQKKYNFEINPILERICGVIGSKKNIDIALALNLSGQAISSLKTRGSVPWKALFIFAQEKAVSFEWLIMGEGEERKDGEKNLADTLEAELSAQKKLESVYSDHIQLQKKTILSLEEKISAQITEIDGLKRENQKLKKFVDGIRAEHCENNDKTPKPGSDAQDKNKHRPKRKAS